MSVKSSNSTELTVYVMFVKTMTLNKTFILYTLYFVQNKVKSHKKGICVERKTGVKCDFELICYKPNIYIFLCI
jgi:hypothetical protein